jgi:ABC-2 type transport system ATP-binding protein
VGPNGVGKTTLLRVLAGPARPTEGSVRILGRPFSSLQRPARVVGACLDPIRLPSLRSGRQHLACLTTAAHLPLRRAGEVLDLVGLPAAVAARRAGTYSLGTRQRLTLAAVLLGDPQVIVLDEPTTGLDVHGVAWRGASCASGLAPGAPSWCQPQPHRARRDGRPGARARPGAAGPGGRPR